MTIRFGEALAPLLTRTYTKSLSDFSNQDVTSPSSFNEPKLENEMNRLFEIYDASLNDREAKIREEINLKTAIEPDIFQNRLNNYERAKRAFKNSGPMMVKATSAQALGEFGTQWENLGFTPDIAMHWPLEITFDHFDLDCMCGLVVGSLTVPLK